MLLAQAHPTMIKNFPRIDSCVHVADSPSQKYLLEQLKDQLLESHIMKTIFKMLDEMGHVSI